MFVEEGEMGRGVEGGGGGGGGGECTSVCVCRVVVGAKVIFKRESGEGLEGWEEWRGSGWFAKHSINTRHQ